MVPFSFAVTVALNEGPRTRCIYPPLTFGTPSASAALWRKASEFQVRDFLPLPDVWALYECTC